ncbi:MAG TPA: hypothetical protein VLA22_07225 [Gaiellaceae bacterium]|nr:hypothetical protein [Gaiellaceae bacterium]
MRRALWMSLSVLLLAGVAVASSGGATQAEARWVITDLGTLGGRESEAVAINERGQIQASGPRVEITSFSHRGIHPIGITAGPDGALWFTNGDSIGRVTTSGLFRIYEDADIRDATGITTGPDGALWFTNGDSIGRITTRGKVTVYPSKSIRYLGDSITAGPDGALWFTMYDEEAMYNGDPRASGIGRITTSGKVTVYRGGAIDGPGGITAGPDAALWFTMFNYKRPYAGIGRITTRGRVTSTELSSGEADGIGPSLGITVGPDRAVWFIHPRLDFDSIGRITTAGKVSIYRRRSIDSPNAIAAGPDGALWFTNDNSIGRITTRGVVSVYKDKSIRSPQGIVVGPDRALWFTNPYGKSIGRLRIPSAR